MVESNIKKRWVATEKDIPPKSLEDARKLLLDSFHSYVQTHAGYIIAIMLGFFAVMSSLDTFFQNLFLIIVFGLLMVGLVGLGIYMILRITYWTSMANYTICITVKYAIQYFNEFNSTAKHYFWDEAPPIAILQNAISQNYKDDKTASWLKRQALKTA